MLYFKHNFAVIELNSDSTNPMIGVINNVPVTINYEYNHKEFKNRLSTALMEHFDIGDEYINIPDTKLIGVEPVIIKPEVDGVKCEIKIMETWLY